MVARRVLSTLVVLQFAVVALGGVCHHLRKCCPRGTAFDVDRLACRTAENVDFPAGNFSVGLPDCRDSVLISVATAELECDANGPTLNGSRVPEEYCVDDDGDGDGGALLVICEEASAACSVRPCIRKCKPLGRYYGGAVDASSGPWNLSFSPSFYNLTTLERDESIKLSHFGVYFGLHCEGGKIRLDREISDVNYISRNGSLYAPGHRRYPLFDRDEFCIEHVKNEGLFTFLCPRMPRKEEESEPLLAVGFIASCVCLLATFVVYLCSRKSKSLYGKTLMCYVGCLCVAYLSLAIVHLGNRYLRKGTCVLLGYSILLSFLAAFFWLNIMSIDIWKTFRSLRATDWRKAPDIRVRFIAYSAYAWGAPVALTATCGLLDALPDTYRGVHVIKPDIGSASCWFSKSTYGMHLFFTAPVSLIITCNVVLYVNTAWRCWKVKAEINKLGVQRRNKGKYSVHREQLLLNGKLFIVMGVSWGPEFLSAMLPHPLWKITDALNTLLGVFIFAIFVLKKKAIREISERVRSSLRASRKTSAAEMERRESGRPERRTKDHVTCTSNV